jgi:hypothetical protein
MRILKPATWLLALAAIAPGSGSPGTAREAGAQDTAPTPIVFIQGSVERSDGSSVGMSSGYQVADGPGPYTMTLHADPVTCRVWAPGGPGAQPPAEGTAWATWRVQFRPVSTADDEATVEVVWSRVVSEGGRVSSESEEALRLVLTPGKPTPLDIVNAPARLGGPCRRFIVAVGAQVGENSGASVLRYDTWLVHRDASGRETVQRQQTNAMQSEEAPFVFMPQYYRRDGSTASNADADALETRIAGTIRGRVRADGSIALKLGTWRGVVVGGGRRSVVWGGTKDLTVRAGETIEVALPSPTERLAELDPDGRVDVDQVTRLEQQSTSIRVTTTRLR